MPLRGIQSSVHKRMRFLLTRKIIESIVEIWFDLGIEERAREKCVESR